MIAKKTTRKKTNGQPTRSRVKEAGEACDRAEATSDAVARMTPAVRRKLVADFERFRVQNAPTMEAAGSDLLELLMAVGAEFLRKYYPDATDASLHVQRYENRDHVYHAHIPFGHKLIETLTVPESPETKSPVYYVTRFAAVMDAIEQLETDANISGLPKDEGENIALILNQVWHTLARVRPKFRGLMD